MNIEDAIKEAARRQMLKRKLTQEELAKRLGVSQSAIAQMIGRRYGKIPSSLLVFLDELGLELTVTPKKPQKKQG